MRLFGGQARRREASRRRPELPAEEALTIDLDGAPLTVCLRRSPRASRLTLRLPTGGTDPVVTTPLTTSTADALRFVNRHHGWLAGRLADRPRAVPFADGAALPLRGQLHRIAHRPGARGTVWRLDDGSAPTPLLCVAGREEHLARRLTDWLKREAKADLSAAVARHAAAIGRKVERITVRDTTSRWGSCSSTGRLSFSWRLVLAPASVLDYVAAHEVAHLVEMNHSARFWRVVHELCPEADTARAWLRREGAALHVYGREAG